MQEAPAPISPPHDRRQLYSRRALKLFASATFRINPSQDSDPRARASGFAENRRGRVLPRLDPGRGNPCPACLAARLQGAPKPLPRAAFMRGTSRKFGHDAARNGGRCGRSVPEFHPWSDPRRSPQSESADRTAGSLAGSTPSTSTCASASGPAWPRTRPSATSTAPATLPAGIRRRSDSASTAARSTSLQAAEGC